MDPELGKEDRMSLQMERERLMDLESGKDSHMRILVLSSMNLTTLESGKGNHTVLESEKESRMTLVLVRDNSHVCW